MTSIKINTGAVRNATTSLSVSLRCIEGLTAVISSVQRVASPIFSISHGLSSEFRQANNTVVEIERDVARLANTVRSIASSYESAEMQNTNRIRNTSMRTGFTYRRLPTGYVPLIRPIGPTFGIVLFGGLGIIARVIPGKKFKWSGSSSFLNGSASLTPEGKWNLTKGEMYSGIKGKAEGWLWKGNGNVDYGRLHGDGTIKVGDVYAEGEAKFSLFKEGKFDPGLGLGVGVGATALAGEVNARYGLEDLNVYGKAEGKVGTASASANAEISKNGLAAGVKAEAYAVKGSVSGGLNLGIVNIGISIEGKAGGAGVEAGVEVGTNHAKGKIGAGLGLGGGAEISIDWSNARKFIGDVATGATETGRAVNSFFSDVGKGVASLWNGR